MEEVRYFGRISLYALVVGVIYWFLSYEAAGTALLIGFGLATGGAYLALRAGAPDRAAVEDAEAARQGGPAGATDTLEGEAGGEPAADADGRRSTRPDGPFADESGPIPMRSAAPLSVGFGLAAMALAGAFGGWFLIAGAVPLLLGAVDWLRAAERELALRSTMDDVEAGEPEDAARASGAVAQGPVRRAEADGVDPASAEARGAG